MTNKNNPMAIEIFAVTNMAIDARDVPGDTFSAPANSWAEIGVSIEAAMGRDALYQRLFCRLRLLSYGRPGGRSRKARRSFTGTPTLVRSSTRLASGRTVQNRSWSKYQMTNTSPSLSSNVIHFPNTHSVAVVNPPRRGRLPKSIPKLSDFRRAREERIQERQNLLYIISALRRSIAEFNDDLEELD
jgi:hypothetical protein